MSVIVTARIEQTRWAGFDEPGFPSGVYIASSIVFGDGSAGFIQNSFLFQLSAEALSARLYSLEQIQMHTGLVGGQVGDLAIIRMGQLSANRVLPDRGYSFQLGATGSGSFAEALDMNTGVLLRPLFLGAPNTRSNTAEVQFSILNGVGEALRTTIMGYIWEPRSLLEPGGLQRPATSIFG